MVNTDWLPLLMVWRGRLSDDHTHFLEEGGILCMINTELAKTELSFAQRSVIIGVTTLL